ncbi:hypothetical protein HNR60_000576 [Rhodopseudomonas rhenobacensis]|uniref:Uncharacterized protein n=1 Tax=Rhodopseudomonas rhenobacensis TaxID=87461 RepID=A0A7W7Z0T8_9BRAD|nr:hypothetical protein [Rhodopseudomonas rhenobacensis]MBB5045841.1 hypothetical protein [Rhodopseudomonas rhenobacensis]
MRILLLIVGILTLLMGLIWTGQGAGLINWPEASFMLKQTQWIYYGGLTALGGAVLIWLSRR